MPKHKILHALDLPRLQQVVFNLNLHHQLYVFVAVVPDLGVDLPQNIQISLPLNPQMTTIHAFKLQAHLLHRSALIPALKISLDASLGVLEDGGGARLGWGGGGEEDREVGVELEDEVLGGGGLRVV